MPLCVNLRHLEKANACLVGELSVEELDLTGVDECVEVALPLKYDLEVQLMENAVLVQGHLAAELRCACVRCLKVFTQALDLRDWAVHLALEGEEAVNVVNDLVDLTPFLREDVLLSFPQHPLCEAGCHGLPNKMTGSVHPGSGANQEQVISPAWAELNKLKL